MTGFDAATLHALNGLARRSYAFDLTMAWLATSNLAKGGALTLVLLWLWSTPGEGQARNRRIVLATGVATFSALLAGRLLAQSVPFRLRPLADARLALVAPYGLGEVSDSWSAFPSDHAMMFVTMATGLWFASRRLGAAASAWVAALILFPRVYLGLHHPTDVLAGAALGVAFGLTANGARAREALAAPLLRLQAAAPRPFLLLLFLTGLGIATMFEDARTAVHQAGAVARALGCGASSPEARCRSLVSSGPSVTLRPAGLPSQRDMPRSTASMR